MSSSARADQYCSARLLRALVRDEALTGVMPDGLLDAARFHGVISLLRFARPDVPGVEHAFLSEQGERLRILNDLATVAAALAPLRWAVVKGPVLSETVYIRRGRRSFCDLDVLVATESFHTALLRLESAGATLLDRNWQLATRQGRAELSLRLPGGSLLDLHWSLLNDAATRRTLALPDLLVGRRPVDLGGVASWGLSPVDALIHVCLHAVLSGGHRLIWIRDIVESLREVGIDELWSRAHALGLELLVATALVRTNEVVPLDVRMPPGVWGWVMRIVARSLPPGRGPELRPTGATLVAATRRSTGSSVAAISRRFYDRQALAISAADLATPVDEGWRRRYLETLDIGGKN